MKDNSVSSLEFLSARLDDVAPERYPAHSVRIICAAAMDEYASLKVEQALKESAVSSPDKKVEDSELEILDNCANYIIGELEESNLNLHDALTDCWKKLCKQGIEKHFNKEEANRIQSLVWRKSVTKDSEPKSDKVDALKIQEELRPTVANFEGNILLLWQEFKTAWAEYERNINDPVVNTNGENTQYFRGKADAYRFAAKQVKACLQWHGKLKD